MDITLDIETIPAQDQGIIDAMRADVLDELSDALEQVKVPGNYKDQAKIDAYVDEAKEKLRAEFEAKAAEDYLKTSFDGGAGQVCVVGWALEDEEPQSTHVDTAGMWRSEGEALDAFFTDLAAACRPTNRMRFIGHNLIAFDLRFIWQRAMVLKIKPPGCFPRDPKPWDDSVFDTMLQWAGARGTISMDRLCRTLGLPGKGDISGKDVWPMVQAGRIEEVAAYCRGDVQRTRAMFKRMTFLE
jgi:hypothetical protein